MESMKPTHFQLYNQITHSADISRYCTEVLLYWMSPDQKFYCTTSHMLPSINSWKKIFSCFGNRKNCTIELYKILNEVHVSLFLNNNLGTCTASSICLVLRISRFRGDGSSR